MYISVTKYHNALHYILIYICNKIAFHPSMGRKAPVRGTTQITVNKLS